MTLLRRAVSTAAVLFVAACSGRASLPPNTASAPLGAAGSATLTVVIKVAKRIPVATRAARAPRWVSPSSQSVSILFTPAKGGKAKIFDINLGSNCATSSGVKTCTASIGLKPGAYTASVSTYDAPNEGGHVLSRGENLPANVRAGKTNVVNLTLGGVPHAIAIVSTTPALRGTNVSGFTLYDASAQLITITAQDADGNTIVGAGTPWVGSVTSGTGWAIEASPSPAHVNQLAVTPPNANGSSATFAVAATYDAATCAASGVVCSASFTVVNDVQILAVSDCGSTCGGTGSSAVYVYQAPYTGTPLATITSGVKNPISVAIAPNGTIFVGNCGTNCGGTGGDSVTAYAPPYGSATATITTGIFQPTQLATNAQGDLIVDNCETCQFAGSDIVTVYSHLNYTGSPVTLSGLSAFVGGIAVDAPQDLLVAACRTTCGYGVPPDAVLQYAPSYTGSPIAITNGIGFGSNTAGMAFDSANDLFVPDCIACSGAVTYQVTAYASPYSGAGNPSATVVSTIASPLALGFDQAGDLFVANGPGGADNNVSEYLPPYASGTKLFGGATYQAYELRVDALGDLIVADGDTVKISTPPYASLTTIRSLAGSSNLPFALAP